jgi:aspartyl protease family protein
MLDGDSYGRLIYLAVLGAAIAGYFIAENRNSLGKTAQQAAIWGLIFLGVIAGYGLWSDIRATVSPRQMVYGEEGRIEVPRARDGSFYLTLEIDGTPVPFIVDTGATEIVLTRRDAERIGLDIDNLGYFATASTANGEVPIAPVKLDEVRLGEFSDRNVRATVNGGELFHSLLGMSYLSRFERLEIAGDRLILTR